MFSKTGIFAIVFALIMLIAIPGALASYEKDMKLANEALTELGFENFEIIKVKNKYIMRGSYNLTIIAYINGKKMHIKAKKPKSVFWEKHSWTLLDIFNLQP